MCPLWVGEGVLSLSYPLLHPGGDGGSTRTVERRKPTQPRGEGGGGGGGEEKLSIMVMHMRVL